MGFRQFSRSDRSQSCHRPVDLWLLDLQSLHDNFVYPSYHLGNTSVQRKDTARLIL